MCHKNHHSGKLAILGWQDTSEGRELRWQPIVEINSQPLIKTTTDERFDMIKERLSVLMSKGKKEKELLQILANEFTIQIKTAELRAWKKRVIT
jgi:hypothetical protein